MSKITVIKRKSSIGCSKKQKRTLEAIGLKKINSSASHEATPTIMGMIQKVAHLVEVKQS